MNKLQELEQQLQNIQAEIEKLKQAEQDNRWVPSKGDEYYVVRNNGEIGFYNWNSDPFDTKVLSIGNVFRTEEEAEFQLERLKVIAELKKYAREFVRGGDNYYMYYIFGNHDISYGYEWRAKRPALCFPSKEIARQAVAEVGEDRVKKYYLGVE